MRPVHLTSRRLIPVVAALATIALIVGVAAVLSDRRATAHRQPAAGAPSRVPPTLALAGSAGGTAHPVPPRDDLVDPIRATSGFRLEATLPSGPATAAAYRLLPERADAASVTRLAQALGLAGEPRRSGPGWVLTSAAARLVVLDGSGLPWTYGTVRAGCLPALPSTGSGTVTSCAIEGAPLSEPSSADTARATAVLRRLGASTAAVWHIGTTFTAPGAVADRPAPGWDTTVTVVPTTRLTNATGYLARPTLLASYPVISATEGYRRLRDLPRMMPLAQRCPLIAGQGCGTPQPVTITGARLGLQLVTDTRLGTLLVPAWLFSVRGDQGVLTGGGLSVVAVTDHYLDQVGTGWPSDAPTPTDGGSGPGLDGATRPMS